MSLLLTIRRDGYFPFNANTSDTLMIIISTLHVLIFLILLIIFFWPNLLAKKFPSKLPSFDSRVAIISIIFLFLAITFVLFYKDYKTFSEVYSFNIPFVILVFLASFSLIAYFTIRKQSKALVISVFAISVLISLIPILYFPLTAKIGDLMPIITEQSSSLVKGENIYQYYLLDNGVWTQAVRQPGTIIAYLPAYILGIDPRIMSIIYTTLTCFVLLKIVYKQFRSIKYDQTLVFVSLGLILFLLSPYRLTRLDLYEPPFWLLLSITLLLISRGKYFLSAIFWGFGIITQVWFWLFTPFLFVFLLKKAGFKSFLQFFLISIGVAILGLAPFIIRDVEAYKEHVFGFYDLVLKENQYNNFTFYLTPWLMKLNLSPLLKILQFLSLAIIGLSALKYLKSFKLLIIYLAFTFFFFIQFNSLSWNYMYLNLILIMLFYFFYMLRLKDI